MSKKKILLEIAENNEYYDFIEDYRKRRELSFTACAKQLLFDHIDELKRTDEKIQELMTKLNRESETIKQEKTRKNMLKNLNNFKKMK